MKVIVDDKIPYIKEEIEAIANEVIYLSGSAFTAETIREADALIIRTRTRCDRHLLQGSRVKFIATATIGYDHIDTDYCEESGIYWTNAPGCNSGSVAQYLHSCLLLLQKEKGIKLNECCIGIVGVGNVGSKVCDVALSLGMQVLLNDPPRQRSGHTLPHGLHFTTLETIERESDIISLHTPLVHTGQDKTLHLANQDFFASLKKTPVFINTSRGEVVHSASLLQAINSGQIGEAIIDVWENEPNIDRTILQKAYIATPHIAGYSANGKANATRMSLQSLCRFFGIDRRIHITLPTPIPDTLHAKTAEEAQLLMYNPTTDSQSLKEHPDKFEDFRGNYPLRYEAF